MNVEMLVNIIACIIVLFFCVWFEGWWNQREDEKVEKAEAEAERMAWIEEEYHL